MPQWSVSQISKTKLDFRNHDKTKSEPEIIKTWIIWVSNSRTSWRPWILLRPCRKPRVSLYYYICIFVYVCVGLFVCVCTCECFCGVVCVLYICACVVCVYLFVCLCAYMCVYLWVCLCVYKCVCLCGNTTVRLVLYKEQQKGCIIMLPVLSRAGLVETSHRTLHSSTEILRFGLVRNT